MDRYVSRSLLEDGVVSGNHDSIARRIIFQPAVAGLDPARARQANVRPMSSSANHTRAAGIPAKQIKIIGDGLGRTRVGGFPGHLTSGIEAKRLPRTFLDFQFTKSGSVFRPTDTPDHPRNEIALMHAIPALDADLDGEKPEEAK